MTSKDGIHSLYHPEIAKQIAPEATRVTEVADKDVMIAQTGEKIHLPGYMTGFLMDIDRMNKMYAMPAVDTKDISAVLTRLDQFKAIVQEELNEIDEIVEIASGLKAIPIVDMADLLGDVIVYCASEAKRWGIPIDRVLNIIMQSNFSKLDENGQPLYDERMKLQKGPAYWKPEPKIAELLAAESGNIGEVNK